MYHYIAILSVLILSLSACGSNETPQVPHDASMAKALNATSLSATKETTISAPCPISNVECNSIPQECATMSENGCPKAGTPDGPKAAAQGCGKTQISDCQKTAMLGFQKTSSVAPTVVTKSARDQVESVVTEVVEVKSSLPTTSILTLSLQNEFGPVFVPHSQHVEMYSCEVCHPTTPPGKIEKTKKEFHALCRKCHADEKAGPTKCRGCHQR